LGEGDETAQCNVYRRIWHRPCKNGRTDQGAICGSEWDGPEELCIRWSRAHCALFVHIGSTWQIQLIAAAMSGSATRGGEWRRGLFPNYLGQSGWVMPATVTVAALCFMEIWKRQQAELQYDWDVADFELEEVNSLRHGAVYKYVYC